MKTIILTQDYEIFFGRDSGTVQNCMIKPTHELLILLKKYNCTMTVFWDVLHLYTIKKHVSNHPELNKDIGSIEEQIKLLLNNGHDIQLHIHPHWLDATYIGEGKWKFMYERYTLHDLSPINDPDDINNISGCVNTSVQVLKKCIKNENLKISFRAGGYCLEPFDALKKVFLKNSIIIDSSKIGIPPNNRRRSINNTPYFKFSETPSIIDDNGCFVEFPIATVSLSLVRKILFKFLERKYRYLDKYGDGISIGESDIKKELLIKRFYQFVKNRKAILTPEGSYKKKFDYLIDKSPDFSVMTLHPKYFNAHQIEMLEDLLKKRKARFISIDDCIKLYGITPSYAK